MKYFYTQFLSKLLPLFLLFLTPYHAGWQATRFVSGVPGLQSAADGSQQSGASESTFNKPEFSHVSGFYSEPFFLQITHDDPGTEIIYTLDGSEPDPGNLSGRTYNYKNRFPEKPSDSTGPLLQRDIQSHIFSVPILIADNTDRPNEISNISTTHHFDPGYFPSTPLRKASVVKARAYKENMEPGEITVATYFVSENNALSSGLPTISITTDEDHFFDYENGIHVAGIDFDEWRAANPNIDTYWYNANYFRRGSEYEVPAHFQYFEGNTEVINQQLGIRIHGSSTRRNQCKSLRLYARNSFGNNTIDYPFFKDLSYDKYKRLILRNTGNDFYSAFIRDPFIHEFTSPLFFDTQAQQAAQVFFNGEYWGLLYIRERYTTQYFERVYGIDEDDLDYLENYIDIKEGESGHYTEMLALIDANDLSSNAAFAQLETYMDVENFIDYLIANIYTGNTDWPGNNIEFFRKRTAGYLPDAPFGHDGRWRWILKDMDFGVGLHGQEQYKTNHIDFALEEDNTEWPNPAWSTFLFRNLMKNDGFRLRFSRRFADLLNTLFIPSRVQGILGELKAAIAKEMPYQIERWSGIQSVEDWEHNIATIEIYIDQRPGFQRQHLEETLGLGQQVNISLQVSNAAAGYIRINTIDINPNTPGISENPENWTGIYFEGMPLEIEAVPYPGYLFSHWTGDHSGSQPLISFTPEGNYMLTAHFEATSDPVPVYFWVMNTGIPNDTPLESLAATYSRHDLEARIQFESCLEGYPFDPGHPNWRKASMERRNSPTAINYMPEANNGLPFMDVSMRGLQVKQPFQEGENENIMVFHVNTTGYERIWLSFAAKDEGAANALWIDYFDEEDRQWVTSGLPASTFDLETDEYRLYEVDFTQVEIADDNPGFQVRVRFDGQDMQADDGNRVTFNNIAVLGELSSIVSIRQNEPEGAVIYPNPFSSTVFVKEVGPDVRYKIYNVSGQLIQSGKIEHNQIQTHGLASGLYILMLDDVENRVIKRIVKK